MKIRTLLATCFALLMFASISFAALSTVRLKDGRTLIGECRKLGGSYSIVLSDGTRTIVPAADIIDIDGKPLVSGAPTSATPTTPPGGTTPAGTGPGDAAGNAETTIAAGGPSSSSVGGAGFEQVKAKAARAEQSIVGVQLWEEFIAKNPNSPDLAAAKDELKKWNDLYKSRAEKIKGKWVGGKELRELKARVKTLLDSAFTVVERDGKNFYTVDGNKGVKKLEEVIAIYPQNFRANFEMGYYYLDQLTRLEGSNELIAKSKDSLERAAKYRPDVAAVWSNLAIVYNFRREYEKSVNAAWTAVQKKDDKDTVGQLIAALYRTPPNFVRANPRVAQIEREAQPLFTKHGLSGGGGGWIYVRPDYDEVAAGEDDPNSPPGLMGNGSGFFVTADGYLLTNRHVVTDEQQKRQPDVAFRIRLEDGTEKMAEVIAIDDTWDVALLKITVDSPVQYFNIAETDPLVGSKALVLGYPANGAGFLSLMVGEGQVKNVNKEDVFHVWYDINTTHGNSGGPMIDAEGNLISIISAGRTAEHTSNKFTYVLGLGPDQIRDFLKRIGPKAPPIKFVPRSKPFPQFDAVELAAKWRKSTLLVMGIRTTSSEVSGKLKATDEKKTKKDEGESSEEGEGDKEKAGATE